MPVVGKHQPRGDHHRIAVILQQRHVFADFTQTTQRNKRKFSQIQFPLTAFQTGRFNKKTFSNFEEGFF
jgi:hypothetical protein